MRSGSERRWLPRSVIDRLRQRKRKAGLTVIYICSNSEIADQNRSKLSDEADSKDRGRLSLLSLQSREIRRQRVKRIPQVFAFTPGTSLQVEHGTGIAKERRLILYLVRSIWQKNERRASWREFFRCTAGRGELATRSQHSKAKGGVSRRHRKRLPDAAQKALGVSRNQPDRSRHWEGRQCSSTASTMPMGGMRGCIPTGRLGKSAAVRRNRNKVIGELRKGLASVSLEYLEPDLTLLDEFQRFSHILKESRDQSSIVGKLFAKGSGAILILSATPYRMYSLAHESEDHHKRLPENARLPS